MLWRAGACFGVCAGLVIVSGASCTSTRVLDEEIDRDFRAGRCVEVSEKIKSKLNEQAGKPDELLYVLDLAMAYHCAEKWDESNRYFQKAAQIADIKDYTSLVEESQGFFVSENKADYKGEDFEKILIHVYQAINYAMKGDLSEALVEARVLNRKLHFMRTEGKRDYSDSAFARYLSALLLEADGSFDNAYIEYKQARTTQIAFVQSKRFGLDLWQAALRARRFEDLEAIRSGFDLSQESIEEIKTRVKQKKRAELIVIFQNGLGPVKLPNPQFNRIPKFYPRHNPVLGAEVEVNGQVLAETSVLDDLETFAIKNLDEKYGALIAKKIGASLAHEAVAVGVERSTDSPILGLLTRFAFLAADQADLRSWRSLPKDIQVARIYLDEGTYEIKLKSNVEFEFPIRTVQLKRGQKLFLNWRYWPS